MELLVILVVFVIPLTTIIWIISSLKAPLIHVKMPIPRNRYNANVTLPEKFIYKLPPYDDKFKSPCFHDKDGSLQCLPSAFILGMPKCGTTDLFQLLIKHPQIEQTQKEPHWWTRQRFQNKRKYPSNLQSYLQKYKAFSNKVSNNPDHIIVDASASTLWDMDYWSRYADYKTNPGAEPEIITAHYIRQILPHSRFLIILRNPTERLYSDYLYFTTRNDSNYNFDKKVQQAVEKMTACVDQFTARACVYNYTLKRSLGVRLGIGMYHIYIEDWFKVFPRERFLILRLEDYHEERSNFLPYISKLLNIKSFPKSILKRIDTAPEYNSRRETDKEKGEMLPRTRMRLNKFYQEYNDKLADLLDDNRFKWA